MDMTLNAYGAWEVTLSSGDVLRLQEARDGGLEVGAKDGRLVIRPNVSNEVVIQVDSHFPDRRVEAAKGRVQEFLTGHPNVEDLPEGLAPDDLKLLAGDR